MSWISISVSLTKLLNAPSQPSSRMLLWLPSMPKPIYVRAWYTGFLAVRGESTTAGTFAAMIEWDDELYRRNYYKHISYCYLHAVKQTNGNCRKGIIPRIFNYTCHYRQLPNNQLNSYQQLSIRDRHWDNACQMPFRATRALLRQECPFGSTIIPFWARIPFRSIPLRV